MPALRSALAAFVPGALFGAGLVVSGMCKPAKVVGFLDLFGDWDPSLAFVMVGAIAVHLVSSRWVRARRAPLFDLRFHVPIGKTIDGRLVGGAVVFGVGWGIAGYCPGPGLVALGGGVVSAAAFVVAMVVGMLVQRIALPSREDSSVAKHVHPGDPPAATATRPLSDG